MSPGETLALIASIHMAAAISPGPNFVVLVQTAVRSRSSAMIVLAGLLTAALVMNLASLLGLGVLLAAMPGAETALRIVCALYLLWLGGKMVAGTFFRQQVAEVAGTPAAGSDWFAGFLTNITNPKSIAYWASVFTATNAFALSAGWKAVMVLMTLAISFGWYTFVIFIVSGSALRPLIEASGRGINRVAGGVMIFFGLKLLVQK